MADQNILREYLVSLGFQVNKREKTAFDKGLEFSDKGIKKIGKTALAAATAFTTMVTVFSREMQKLYYNSRYAGTTMETMQAMEFGAQRIGLEGGKATQALKSMGAAFRSNPGLVGLVESMGIKVTGRDRSDVMLDFIGALKKMPFYVAERYANLFGMDPETLFNMEEGLQKLREMKKLREDMAADMGVNLDASADQIIAYGDAWGKLKARVDVFGQAVTLASQGPMIELMGATEELLKDWTKIAQRFDHVNGKPSGPHADMKINHAGETAPPGIGSGIWTAFTGKAEGERAHLTEEQKARIGAPLKDSDPRLHHKAGDYDAGKLLDDWERFQRWRDRKTGRNFGQRVATDPAAVDAIQDDSAFKGGGSGEQWGGTPDGGNDLGMTPEAYLRSLEDKYGLPHGVLDAMWRKESGRGTNMVSKKGAEGHFQFMPKTQDEYGLSDPYDLKESADAAARKMRDALRNSKGNLHEALARYNWGDGNLQRYGLGKAPQETVDYMKDIEGQVQFSQNVNINVHGSDPQATGRAVAAEQKAVGADLVRNLSPKVR